MKQKPMKPSEVTGLYWLWAYDKTGKRPRHDEEKGGKWLIFVAAESVDATWAKIRKATEAGRLGHVSKVATNRPSPLAEGLNRVICVYTYNFDDRDDVMRVRAALSRMGFTTPLGYKTDEATRRGIYGPESIALRA